MVSEIVGVSQVLKHAFEPMFSVILASLDASAVFMRTKALRALGLVVIEDPAILRTVRVWLPEISDGSDHSSITPNP